MSDRGTGDDDIFVMNADGSGKRSLTNSEPLDSSPAWSPDGTKIAFVAQLEPANAEIFVMKADGSGQKNLSENRLWDDSPAWRP